MSGKGLFGVFGHFDIFWAKLTQIGPEPVFWVKLGLFWPYFDQKGALKGPTRVF